MTTQSASTKPYSDQGAMVNDADKDAAVECAHALGMDAEQFTAGACDVLVQAFAAHRENVTAPLREAIQLALSCTPSIRSTPSQFHGHSDIREIVYDCGDPWKILRTALGETGA